jgi:hypothetical protein
LNFELCHNGQNLGAFVPWLLGPWLLSPSSPPQNTPTTITTPYSPTQIRRLFTINILHSLVVWLEHHQSSHNFSGAKGGPKANEWNLLLLLLFLLLYIARIYSLFQKWITICLESLWVLSHFNSMNL